MKIFISACLIILVFFIMSCSPKIYYDGFIGTWVPLNSNSFPIITRLQIEKRNAFFILGAEDFLSPDQPFFFVCKKNNNHLTFTPSQYNINEYDDEYILKQTSDIYFDKDLNCLYFLNTIYIPSRDKIFEIRDNKISIIPKK
jgi:hypothetical protein